MLSDKWINDLVETEQHLIGGVILHNEYFDMLELSHDDFYEALHREIFREIESLIASGDAVTPISLKSRLTEEMSGLEVWPYLVRLCGSTTCTSRNILTYQKHIKEGSTKCRLHDIAQDVMHHEGESAEIIGDLEQGLSEIHKGIGGRVKTMQEQIDASLTQIENVTKGIILGLSTGLKNLDHFVGGLHDGRVYIIAGRPAMGKSTLASQIAMNIVRQDKGVLFFNLEMSADEMLQRIYSEMIYTGQYDVEYNKMSKGVTDSELEKICRVGNDLKNMPLVIDDTANLSLMKLKTRCRAHIRDFERRGIEVGAIFIDYLQLMSAGDRYRGHKVQEIGEISRGLKILAKELKLPVIALSQLSRGVEARENKRPMLSDLRESGDIEQDADCVMFTYRHEYYLEKEEPKEGTSKYIEWQSELADVRGLMEVIVSKQRSGPTGIARQRCELGSAKVHD